VAVLSLKNANRSHVKCLVRQSSCTIKTKTSTNLLMLSHLLEYKSICLQCGYSRPHESGNPVQTRLNLVSGSSHAPKSFEI
jgi:hypothetical protein